MWLSRINIKNNVLQLKQIGSNDFTQAMKGLFLWYIFPSALYFNDRIEAWHYV